MRTYITIRHPASGDIYACEIITLDGMDIIARAYGPLDRVEQVELRNPKAIAEVLDNHGFDVIEDAQWLQGELDRIASK